MSTAKWQNIAGSKKIFSKASLKGFPNLKGSRSFSIFKINKTISYEKAEKWSNNITFI